MSCQYVRLTKVASSDHPLARAGNSLTYPYGTNGADTSLPEGYWLEGWLLTAPKVGRPVMVLRLVRAGIEALGLFKSTMVLELKGEDRFRTMNSIYRWEKVDQPRWPRLRDLPVDERTLFAEWLQGSAVPLVKGCPLHEQDFFFPWDFVVWSFLSRRPDGSGGKN